MSIVRTAQEIREMYLDGESGIIEEWILDELREYRDDELVVLIAPAHVVGK